MKNMEAGNLEASAEGLMVAPPDGVQCGKLDERIRIATSKGDTTYRNSESKRLLGPSISLQVG